MRLLMIAVAWLLVGAPLSAQQRGQRGLGMNAVLGAGWVESKFGGLFGIGASAEVPWVVVRLLFDVHVSGSGESDYSWQLQNSEPVCRDKSSGAIVNDSYCNPTKGRLGVSADGSIRIPSSQGAVYAGGGFRAGDGSTPYVTLGYGFDPGSRNWHLLIRGIAGKDLLQAQAVGSVPVHFGS